jgi:hypothetical protein
VSDTGSPEPLVISVLFFCSIHNSLCNLNILSPLFTKLLLTKIFKDGKNFGDGGGYGI